MPCIFIALLLMSFSVLNAQDRAAWMKEARWGVMTHYLADWIARADAPDSDPRLVARRSRSGFTVDQWNALVNNFDVETLARQLQSVGAGYYQISLGQNSGFYLSPNAS